jgi:hypothetical protein
MSFTIQTLNGVNMAAGEYMVIAIPKSFNFQGNLTTGLCTNNYNCSLFNGDNKSIKVTAVTANPMSISTTNNFTIDLGGIYVSPRSFNSVSDPFLVTTYSNDTNPISPIDITDPVNDSLATFHLTCSGKCATCRFSNLSYCKSCYLQ